MINKNLRSRSDCSTRTISPYHLSVQPSRFLCHYLLAIILRCLHKTRNNLPSIFAESVIWNVSEISLFPLFSAFVFSYDYIINTWLNKCISTNRLEINYFRAENRGSLHFNSSPLSWLGDVRSEGKTGHCNVLWLANSTVLTSSHGFPTYSIFIRECRTC